MKTVSASSRSARLRGASSQRRERQKQELRQAILNAAGQEFLEHGYESFSLRRVAERIGYSATTIYLYFTNKDDLLLATVQSGFASFDREVAAAADTADPLARIEALGRAYIRFGLEHPALYRLMFMQRSDFYFMPRFEDPATPGEAAAAAPVAASLQPRPLAQTLLVTAVREGIERGQVRPGDPQLLADALWAGAHGLVSLATSPLMTREYAHSVAEVLLRTLIDGLCT